MADRFRTLSVLVLGSLLLLMTAPVLAGSTSISINASDSSATFTIRNEPALVINGFDLGAQNLAFPVTIDAVTLNVVRPIPGQTVTVVVYEDSNGGTPQDARVISRADVSILNTGTVRIALPQPAATNSRIVWAGFYLPVDFQFTADQSGSSVLTYWAWTPNNTFDLGNLASAAIFGPGDGSAPASINMGGIARIGLELNQADGRTGTPALFGGEPLGQQIVSDVNPDLNVLSSYPGCGNIMYDPADIQFAGGGTFTLACRVEGAPMQPGVVGNIGLVPSSVPGFERRGQTYQVFANGDYQLSGSDATLMKTPVTHCIAPNAGDLEKAVIGNSYGVPQKWYILPTQRYGDYVCAEVTNTGPVSYFVPRAADAAYINADLIWSAPVATVPGPAQFFCDDAIRIIYKIKNDGFEATPVSTFRVTNVAVRTGQTTYTLDIPLPSIGPGETIVFDDHSIQIPDTFLNEANRLVFLIDGNNNVAEINEANNTQIIDYILKPRPTGC